MLFPLPHIPASPKILFLFLCALGVSVVKSFSSSAQESPRSFRATNAKLESDYPSLAWTGHDLGLAWMDGRDGNEEIYFRRVETSLGKLGPEFRLTDSANWDYQPQLVSNGSGFGLAWVHERKEKRDIYFVRLSESGNRQSAPIRILDQGMIEKATRLEWTGRGYGLVWTDYRPGNPEIFFQPLSLAGQPAGEAARVTEGPGLSEPGGLIWTGSGFALVYLDSREGSRQVYFARLNQSGVRLGAEQKLSAAAGDATLPGLAWNGSNFAAVWTERHGSFRQAMVAVMDAVGVVIRTPIALTADSSDKIQAAVAPGNFGFGISFWAKTGTSRVLQFLFLPSAEAPAAGVRNLTPARRAEAELQASSVCPALSMAFDGSAFIIGWVDLKENLNSEIYLTRVIP